LKPPTESADFKNAQEANETFYFPETLCQDETERTKQFISELDDQLKIAAQSKPIIYNLRNNETRNNVSNITISSPVDLSGLSSRSRVSVIRQVVQKVGDMRQQIERKENGPKQGKVKIEVTVKVTYKFGERNYSVDHIPTSKQNGNVLLHFINKIDGNKYSIRQNMNLMI
jgi:hypothetical protein